jgi:hypothetical protein
MQLSFSFAPRSGNKCPFPRVLSKLSDLAIKDSIAIHRQHPCIGQKSPGSPHLELLDHEEVEPYKVILRRVIYPTREGRVLSAANQPLKTPTASRY